MSAAEPAGAHAVGRRQEMNNGSTRWLREHLQVWQFGLHEAACHDKIQRLESVDGAGNNAGNNARNGLY